MKGGVFITNIFSDFASKSHENFAEESWILHDDDDNDDDDEQMNNFKTRIFF